jgi:hypothetical protein
VGVGECQSLRAPSHRWLYVSTHPILYNGLAAYAYKYCTGTQFKPSTGGTGTEAKFLTPSLDETARITGLIGKP